MKKILILLGLLLLPTLAEAQTSRNPCYTTSGQSGTMPNCIGVGTATPLPTTTSAPGGGITGNAAGTTGAVVGTLAAAVGKTTFICGFNVQAIGGTATVGPVTVAGLVGSSQVYQTDVNSATVGKTVASASFSPCVSASATNTAITITTTANGTATAVNVNSWVISSKWLKYNFQRSYYS
jgi:hypothetical protein